MIITSRNLEAGQRVADELNNAGLKVCICCHSCCTCLAALNPCEVSLPAQGHVEVQQLDLADLSSVQALGNRLNQEQQIDLLILNAGVMACPEDVTKDNFELQVGTNHFGHFQLTRLLLEKLKQQASAPDHPLQYAQCCNNNCFA